MATAIIMPRQGQSVESCILVEWKVKVGDDVALGQPLASIETDKAVFEVEAPAAGKILELFFPEGSDIPVLTNIAAVGDAGEDVSSLRPDGAAAPASALAAQPEAAPAAAAAPAASAPTEAPAASGSSPVSPRARKLAAEKGVEATVLAGSGPGGRVIEQDVKVALAGQPRLSAAAKAAVSSGAPVPATGSGPAGMVLAADLKAGAKAPAAAPSPVVASATPTTEIAVKGIRKIIAERMKQSLASTAQLTMTMSCDATAMQAYRARVKAQGEALGLPKISLNDLICYATARTLKKHPSLNAQFLGDKVVQHSAVHLGIAVDTPRGLMVPVVRGADGLSLAGFAAAIKPLAASCQQGSISPDLLSGGTFTITNLGALGVETFTPVLNVPEVAILGVGGLTLKPVRKDGQVVFVESISLSLTVDHQVVDGAPAAKFLKELCTALENIDLLLSL